MKKYLFDNWHQWKVCFLAGCKSLGWGSWRIITCILLGIVSVFVYIGKQIEAFCRREFLAALIIGLILVLGASGWLGTFVIERTARVTAEFQRDSLALKLDSAKQYSRRAYKPADSLAIRNHWNRNE